VAVVGAVSHLLVLVTVAMAGMLQCALVDPQMMLLLAALSFLQQGGVVRPRLAQVVVLYATQVVVGQTPAVPCVFMVA
jgi:hypothetical protein